MFQEMGGINTYIEKAFTQGKSWNMRADTDQMYDCVGLSNNNNKVLLYYYYY